VFFFCGEFSKLGHQKKGGVDESNKGLFGNLKKKITIFCEKKLRSC